jgi:peptidyl-prolyl cis-trans isomerase D
MLDSLRGFATTWMGKLFGAVLLVGLAGFGISGVLTGIGTNTIAKVGGQDISVRDFQRVYNVQLNNAAAQIGTIPTAEQAMAFGLPSAAVTQLANQAAMTDLGQNFGLGVSDERLGTLVRNDPSFGSVLGAFDQDNFQRILQQNGYTQNEYFAEQSNAARAQQIELGLFGGVTAPETASKLVNRFTTDTRTVDFFVINPTTIETPADPTEAELQAYLNENQADYRTLPTRTVNVMVLTPEAIAKRIEISKETIDAEYERTKSRYAKPEFRTISQVILPSDLLVQLFEQGQAAGKSLDDLIAETSLPVTELGTLSAGQITDTALKDAAFSLSEGAFTLIPAAQGMRAIAVTKIDPAGQQTVSEVSAEIAEKLQLRQARDSYIDILDQIEEFRAAFKPLNEIADNFTLEIKSIDVTASGAALADVTDIPEAGRGRVASAIFSAEQGALSPTVALSANLNVWFDIEEVTDARDQTLDELRDELTTTIVNERTEAATLKEAQSIIDEIKGGTAFVDAAVARNVFAQLSPSFSRQGDGSPIIDAAVANAAFAGGPGHVGYAKNGEEDYVVFQVIDIASNGDELPEATADNVNRVFVDSLYGSFLSGVRDSIGVSINQGVLERTLGLNGQ